jgi:ketosteroid isomerase-like protein
MSQLNVNVVRSFYDAFDSNDLDGVLENVDGEVQIFATEGLPWSGVYSGPAGVEEFIRTIEEHVRLSIETEELIDSGESIAQIGRTVGEAHATGQHFDLREIHIWGLRAGKIVRFQNYVDTEGQRAALGLPPEEPPADDANVGPRETFWG